MIRLEWLLLMQLVMGLLMIVLLRKINQMKKQEDEIIKEVTSYIRYITEEENSPETKIYKEKKEVSREESQTQLIQAVLGEYFP